MKSEIRLPSNFLAYQGDPIVSNIDNQVKAEVEIAIKNKPLFSQYAAWNFNGLIWWNDEIGYWAAEVWVLKKYNTSYTAETLEDLANEMDDAYGKGETAFFESIKYFV